MDRVGRREGRRWRAKVISAVRIVPVPLDLLGLDQDVLSILPPSRIAVDVGDPGMMMAMSCTLPVCTSHDDLGRHKQKSR